MSKLFAKPLGALLKFVFDMISKAGGGVEPEIISFYAIAIILTTIIFKLILLPLGLAQSKSTRKMQEIQPKLKEIQEKYKNDPQTQQAKTMELYKENNMNPFGSCLIMLVQLPILFGFFRVMREPIEYVFKSEAAYAAISKTFLWIKNLEQPDPYLWGLPLLAGVTTFLQSKLMTAETATDPKAGSTQRTMNIMLPFMIFWAARSFPAGLALYWVIGNTFQIVQSLITNRSLGKIKEDLD
ncbi:MAG TPA: YidC/Oxa1 family membrane protein insertase [Tissierellales bacterium]|nr:YidC/Oxa1 family membrane protein insertase [Tissierellales bacterium]